MADAADDATRAAGAPCRSASGLAIAAAVGFTLVVGIFPDWLLDAAERPPSSPADGQLAG